MAPNLRIRIDLTARRAELYRDRALVAERTFDRSDAGDQLLMRAVELSIRHDTIRTIELVFPEHLGK